MFKSKDNSGRIFRDELYLTSHYDPDEPICREEEIRRLTDAVKRWRHKRTPESILVHGPAGIGKTTCVNHVLDTVTSQTRIKSVGINCWQYNTRPALITELLIQLGYPAPRKGKPVDELLSKLREWLDKNRGVIVALDEFDRLDDRTEIVYDFHMISKQAENPIGLIMVSNQESTDLELDARSESRLNYRTVEFKPYSKKELTIILQKRVEQAFLPGTVTQESIELIAQHSAEVGDCRHALKLLLRAGQRAEEEGINEVTPRMVDLELSSDG